ncbi:hypothetical protein TRAPUB_11407 [Trametes pubescens]|uniref:Uncharacterized protein n=1 Tax=Trametes pubescens TaxID=154538 RepID=A0A1M2VWP1_TRAPU|nr:hypothetical protein TRAPUB_11407 [Trametes pubescens]
MFYPSTPTPPAMSLSQPTHYPRPDHPPISGSRTLFVVPRERTWKCAPQVAEVVTVYAEGGVPLLRVALAPCEPLGIGSIIYARMLGPPEGPDPMKRRRASKEIGIEGRIVAARPFGEKEVEFVVKNESWGLSSYASIITAAIPAATTTLQLLQDLITHAPEEMERGDPRHKPVRTKITGVPGAGPRDTDLMYLVDSPRTPTELRFRRWYGGSADVKSREQETVDITAALGYGWMTGKSGEEGQQG